MTKHFKLLGFYFWLLGLFTIGRWVLSLNGADYAKTTHVFSLVTLALIASAHHAAFARVFQAYRLKDALVLGATIGVVTQLVVFISTLLSYLLGLTTFWNTPAALNQTADVPFAAAMVARVGGLVVNTILNVIAAAIGFAMGGSLKPGK
ncbi:MAG: hypothetical protein KBH14_13205 [Vicinamibacteria bacterium]|jgi:hypothetical protein|nr:hypothetical protein [Vicinamibacteria bacterium]MBP9947354.1 hypothetical protein [Vicinamibacteria bacterium]